MSTSGGVKYIGGYHVHWERGYHEYIGGYHDVHVGDTISTLKNVQYIRGYHEYIGGYHEYIGVFNRN